MFSFLCISAQACERTPIFQNIAEAQAYVASGKPVNAVIQDPIVFNQVEIFKVLVAHYRIPLNLPFERLATSPLGDAIRYDASDIIHYLINERGIKPTCAHVHWALAGFHHKSLEALLSYPVDIQGKDYFGQTPIEAATKQGDTRAVNLLEAYKAKSAKK